MKHAFHRQIHVDNLGQRELHQRQKDAFHRFAHPSILHRRFANDRRRVDRVFAVSDAGDVEDGVIVFQRVKASVIAEWTFRPQFVELHVTFKDYLGIGWHF